MNIFWYKCIEFIPPTIAPNMITLIGFIFVFSSTFLMLMTGDEMSSERPTFVYLYSAFIIFLY